MHFIITGYKHIMVLYKLIIFWKCICFHEFITTINIFIIYFSQTKEINFKRRSSEALGLHVLFDGVVAEVDKKCCAYRAGIKRGCRLVEVCGEATIMLKHEEIIDKLRNSTDVRVSIIEPASDGEPRRYVIV